MPDTNFEGGKRKQVSKQFARYLSEYYSDKLMQLLLTTEAGADQGSATTDTQRSTGTQANQVEENGKNEGETEGTEVSSPESEKEDLQTTEKQR